MKALRLVITQTKAHYRKEETVTNKMTYPLPPYSTVIGAIHSACGFKKYESMELSIQGRFESLSKQAYTDYCFLDTLMDDRGILVKLKNSYLQSNVFEKIATALKSTGNSFKKNNTIQIHNNSLLKEYQSLKKLNEEIDLFKKNKINKVNELIKERKRNCTKKIKKYDKKSAEYKELKNREQELRNLEKRINTEFKDYKKENYEDKISKFKSLTTSLKFYENLHNVELIIHIRSSDEILRNIYENIYNLKSIGRSEDFVDVKECKIVELKEASKLKNYKMSKYSAYIPYDFIKNENVFFINQKDGIPARGTRYKINSIYTIDDFKRNFKKADVVYCSNYRIDEESENVYIDDDYIVCFYEEGKYV